MSDSEIKLFYAQSSEVKNRILAPDEHLRAIDTGAYYVAGPDGKPQAVLTATLSAQGLVNLSVEGIRSDADLVMYGYRRQDYDVFRVAMADTWANIADTKIGIVGDSTDRGAMGAAGLTTWLGAQANSWPRRLADRMNIGLIPASAAAVFGDGGMGNVNFDLSDARSMRGSFAAAGTPRSAGGAFWACASGNTGAAGFRFTPLETVDTFDIYFSQFASSLNDPAVAITIDGSAPASGPSTYNANAAPTQITKLTVTSASAGTRQVEVRPGTASKTTFLLGIRGRHSTTKRVLLDNLGWGSSKTSDWLYSSTYASDPTEFIAYEQYPLTIVNLTINDTNAGTDVATWSANMQTIINAAKTGGGNVLLMMGNSIVSDTTLRAGVSDAYWVAMRSLADANSCAAVDLRQRWGMFAGAVASGYLDAGEGVHPTPRGYADKSSLMLAVLRHITF